MAEGDWTSYAASPGALGLLPGLDERRRRDLLGTLRSFAAERECPALLTRRESREGAAPPKGATPYRLVIV